MTCRIPTALPITKLQPPPREARHLPRPHLVERLCTVRSLRLALIVAPTGTGKTTLLAETCCQLIADGITTAWLTLDHGEQMPRQFLNHLIIALQQALPNVGREAHDLLQDKAASIEAALGSLINDLTEVATPLTIFLDRFQERCV